MRILIDTNVVIAHFVAIEPTHAEATELTRAVGQPGDDRIVRGLAVAQGAALGNQVP